MEIPMQISPTRQHLFVRGMHLDFNSAKWTKGMSCVFLFFVLTLAFSSCDRLDQGRIKEHPAISTPGPQASLEDSILKLSTASESRGAELDLFKTSFRRLSTAEQAALIVKCIRGGGDPLRIARLVCEISPEDNLARMALLEPIVAGLNKENSRLSWEFFTGLRDFPALRRQLLAPLFVGIDSSRKVGLIADIASEGDAVVMGTLQKTPSAIKDLPAEQLIKLANDTSIPFGNTAVRALGDTIGMSQAWLDLLNSIAPKLDSPEARTLLLMEAINFAAGRYGRVDGSGRLFGSDVKASEGLTISELCEALDSNLGQKAADALFENLPHFVRDSPVQALDYISTHDMPLRELAAQATFMSWMHTAPGPASVYLDTVPAGKVKDGMISILIGVMSKESTPQTLEAWIRQFSDPQLQKTYREKFRVALP